MRDPNRIDAMLREIGWHWKRCPDLRLGQLLVNASQMSDGPADIFYVEDDRLLEMVRVFSEAGENYDGS